MKRNGGSPPRREVKRSKTTTVLLPLELIIEILLRLPVKSLVRFKIVCKSWLSLISDPHFTTSHFELAAAPTDRLLLIVDGPREVLSVDFNASLHAIAPLSVELPVQKPYIKNVVILGSCRGFLLFMLWHTLCVCNPSTGVHKQVPCSPIASSDEGSMLYLFLRGFGYDPSTDDYLVVQAYCNILILDDDDPAVRVEVFSLRANEWKEIETNLLSYGNTNNPFENEIGLLLNGAVHWLAHLWDESTFNIVILAFDLTERSFLEIPLPVDFMYDQDQLSVLVALGELLSLCACVGSNHSLEIWVMKEYKVQSSWTRTIVVSLDDAPNRCFYPICSTKSGDIVGYYGKGGLAKCNDKGQLREHRSYFNGEFGPRAALYRESLLSLPCDSEQAVKDD